MGKICNQAFVKDTHRNKFYAGTQKCFCCLEECHIAGPLPIRVDAMLTICSAFVELHESKGCNKVKLPAPEWASGEIGFSLGVESEINSN